MSNPKIVTENQLTAGIEEIIDGVAVENQPYHIQRDGKNIAVLMSYKQFEAIKQHIGDAYRAVYDVYEPNEKDKQPIANKLAISESREIPAATQLTNVGTPIIQKEEKTLDIINEQTCQFLIEALKECQNTLLTLSDVPDYWKPFAKYLNAHMAFASTKLSTLLQNKTFDYAIVEEPINNALSYLRGTAECALRFASRDVLKNQKTPTGLIELARKTAQNLWKLASLNEKLLPKNLDTGIASWHSFYDAVGVKMNIPEYCKRKNEYSLQNNDLSKTLYNAPCSGVWLPVNDESLQPILAFPIGISDTMSQKFWIPPLLGHPALLAVSIIEDKTVGELKKKIGKWPDNELGVVLNNFAMERRLRMQEFVEYSKSSANLINVCRGNDEEDFTKLLCDSFGMNEEGVNEVQEFCIKALNKLGLMVCTKIPPDALKVWHNHKMAIECDLKRINSATTPPGTIVRPGLQRERDGVFILPVGVYKLIEATDAAINGLKK